MRSIRAKKLTNENFREYGEFYDMLHPSGNHIGDFYRDHVLYHTSGRMPVAFSVYVATKAEEMIVDSVEYHDYTGEISMPLDGDIVLHVAPASKEPVPELTEAFIVPKGTLVKLNPGVWHLAAMPIDQDKVNVLIVLPERTYKNDCVVVDYQPKEQIKITVPNGTK